MEKTLSLGAFTELDNIEIMDTMGGDISIYFPHPVFPYVGIKVTYNKAAAIGTGSTILGGAISGSSGGLAGVALGAIGGLVGATGWNIGTGDAQAEISILGF